MISRSSLFGTSFIKAHRFELTIIFFIVADMTSFSRVVSATNIQNFLQIKYFQMIFWIFLDCKNKNMHFEINKKIEGPSHNSLTKKALYWWRKQPKITWITYINYTVGVILTTDLHFKVNSKSKQSSQVCMKHTEKSNLKNVCMKIYNRGIPQQMHSGELIEKKKSHKRWKMGK